MTDLLYIDPGSGSFLVQAIIAAVLGVGFFFRNIWNFIKSIFHRTSKNKDEKPAS
ncbi:MAG: hypothetical protein ACO25B_11115 [Chitinophagaceae bacterium]